MSRWKVLNSEEIFKTGFFRLRADRCELPDARVMPKYYVMEFADWVNVVPVTADGQMVMVRQYRHAANEMFLEIPGGSTDPRLNEEARVAGERELLEETGYRGGEWIGCGFHFPNPALQTNRMHTYLALNCVWQQKPELDPFEDLSVELMPVKKVYELLGNGGIQHSLIAASLSLARAPLQERGML